MHLFRSEGVHYLELYYILDVDTLSTLIRMCPHLIFWDDTLA